MKAVLGAVVLVLVAACSSDDTAPKAEAGPTPSPQATGKSTPPEPELPPRKRLKAAQLALSRTTAGAYDLAVDVRGADTQFMREKGRFNALREILEVERAVPHPDPEDGKPTWLNLRVRSSTQARYLQIDDGGPWEGCWMDLSSGLTSLLGVDVSEFPNIPAPVAHGTRSR